MSSADHRISCVIITKNEERNIERCIKSVREIADDIVVIDSLSTDKTKEICLSLNVRFIEQPFLGYIEQKNKALEHSLYPYVLSLDADEALSEELLVSIKQVKKHWQTDGYFFNRRTNYCGKWIRHCGWYPDQKLRLFDKRKGQWEGKNPHDKYTLFSGASQSFLKGDILHYSYYSIDQHIDQIKKFTNIMAQESFKNGKKPSYARLIFSPFIKFIKSYFIQAGFLDGHYGFIICILSSCATFLKYIKTYELFKQTESKFN
jgi:glycosyltransferase involved in cell wall biosynthesis